MTYWQSILLGVVQGLGEFLPISSSAHLVITPWLFGFEDPGLTFDVALHFGTLFALIAYFWKDWLIIFSGSFRAMVAGSSALPESKQSLKILLYLIVGTIPGAVAGLLLNDFAETTFRNPVLIAVNMSILGGVLMFADRNRSVGSDLTGITWTDALTVGFSQALALIPGVSRSGVTMTAGLLLGMSRVTAARFSFLLAAPITFGACLVKAKPFLQGNVGLQEVTGILVSGLVGFLAIKYLLKYVQVKDYRPFAYYRFVFTVVVIAAYFLK